jgi:hypothetical protein
LAKRHQLKICVVPTTERNKKVNHQVKLRDLYKAIEQRARGNGLILICNAYNVRLMCGAEEIIAQYKELSPKQNSIVFAGERKYEHHHKRLPEIAWKKSTPHEPYIFPGSDFIGPRRLVLKMLKAIIDGSGRSQIYDMRSNEFCQCIPRLVQACDQSLCGMWAFRNLNKKAIIDSGAKLFWSARGEQRNFFERYAIRDRGRLRNRETRTQPCVIHVPPL